MVREDASSPDQMTYDASPADGMTQTTRSAVLASIATAAAALPHRETGLEAIEDPAELRDEISDLAARVIDMTARSEGPGSPIEAILGEAGSDVPRESLAGRVRALRAARSSEAAE